MFTTIISAAELWQLLAEVGDVVVFDCRHKLDKPDAGEAMYREGHIPGALYANLDTDLAGTKELTPSGHTGRHPLPETSEWMRRIGRWGIGPQTQVIVYDDAGGMMAGRLWWMLRAVGHMAVAVLDGGLAAWNSAGGALESGVANPARTLAPYPGRFRSEWVADMDEIRTQVSNPDAEAKYLIVDARTPERYRGEVEPYGPIAGHIPGAKNVYYGGNLKPDGTFRSAEELRARFAPVVEAAGEREVVMSCGSGVSACHNLLAMEIAGLPAARLFPNSWSGWTATPGLPVAKGEEA
jgi:thiosulfate/3-mercaptopyruvate sulfurtransferase